MSEQNAEYALDVIGDKILSVRGLKVILDRDLAALYGVPTKRLNEQIKRNQRRFPCDFMIRLSRLEVGGLNRSQFATGSGKHRDPRFLPFAFTEYGALMAANVLNSDQAVEMSLFIVRAFVKLRERLAMAGMTEKRIADIEMTLVDHDAALKDLYKKIRPLQPSLPLEKPKRRIGFTAEEKGARYGVRATR
jgi:hypothetical protein